MGSKLQKMHGMLVDVKDGKVMYGLCPSGSYGTKRAYPYTWNGRYNAWVNRSGELTVETIRKYENENRIKWN